MDPHSRPAPKPHGERALDAARVAASALRFGNVAIDRGDIYWVEGRPQENGRSVVVKCSVDGAAADATPAGANVRTRVQEYGGAAFAVSNGTIYYSEFSDHRLYRLEPGGAPQPLTPPGPWRYADASIDPRRPRLVCVREEHRGDVVDTSLVAIAIEGGVAAGERIASGYDFYSTPRFSPDGSALAWLAWRHPQMPWDGTELWVAPVAADGSFGRARLVAGSAGESVFQPGWSPDGVLHFVSDRTGWWNLYRARDGGVEHVFPIAADCGRPQWVLGTATWAFVDRATLVMAVASGGRWSLRQLRLRDSRGTVQIVGDRLLTDIEPGEFLAADEAQIACVGGADDRPDAVFRIDAGSGRAEALRTAGEPLDADLVSHPRAIEFPVAGGLTAHAFYYAPHAPSQPRPLIVVSHGGPTSAASARLNLEIQFWTSRGFAVADVNYGGSTGFGRAYRERLNGNWGIVDVDDCVDAVRYLVRNGLAGERHVFVRGRSAGGYTTLAALTRYPHVFAAGAIYYGIGDLELLARDTHKFESRYLDRLVGPYPEARALYRARSPIHHVDRLACPIIVFQGLDDKVVPPEHAHVIVAAARAKGIDVELHEFPAEAHGFRKADTIVRCLEAELAFYEKQLA